MDDEIFSRSVAFEHVQSGIAWVPKDGPVGSMNVSLASTLLLELRHATGMSWFDLFDVRDRSRLDAAYSQMLLAGKATVGVHGRNRLVPRTGDLEAANQEPLLMSEDIRASLEHPELELLLVGVHDSKMRFIGHYCLVEDRTRERLLEAHLREVRHERDQIKNDLLALNRAGQSHVLAQPVEQETVSVA